MSIPLQQRLYTLMFSLVMSLSAISTAIMLQLTCKPHAEECLQTRSHCLHRSALP